MKQRNFGYKEKIFEENLKNKKILTGLAFSKKHTISILKQLLYKEKKACLIKLYTYFGIIFNKIQKNLKKILKKL